MNTQELPLVTFEQAKRLKQLGFDWEIFEFYAENGNGNHWKNAKYDMPKNWNIMHDYKSYDIFYSAPTVALALKWFRDINGIATFISPKWIFQSGFRYKFEYYDKNNFEHSSIQGWESLQSKEDFNIYESAESALLDELLTILEKEKDSIR